MSKIKLTFIIPSIGRPSLINSLESIINQTVCDWCAIVMFDGIEPTLAMPNEQRIKFMQCEKKGIGKNNAGNVRNEVIQHVKTEWIAFLDDDDYLSPRYVETFLNEINNYLDMDLLIFRMYNNNTRKLLPELDRTNLEIGKVGISFIVKTCIFDKIIFKPSNIEDYTFLETVLNNGFIIYLSQYVRYFVNVICDFPEFTNDEKVGLSCFIK